MAKFIEAEFYCINCGQKGLDCLRKDSKQRKSFHRKRLYCTTCKAVINHVQINYPKDLEEFKRKFANGEYKEEAVESIKHSKQKDWWCY